MLNGKMSSIRKRKNSQNYKRQQTECKIEINKNEFELNVIQVGWSTKDKKMLLEALKRYGSEDITAISNMLPNFSPEQIKRKISEYSQIAKEKDELLNQWLKCGLYQPGDSLIPEALLFIKLFEDHPPPSESGYDFRAIYNVLYRSCFEEPPFFDLSPEDTNILYSLLSKIEEKSWPKYEKHLWEYVGRIYNKKNIKKVYPGKNTRSL